MADKYRVAVIGRTGKGDYGHGLDVVWREIDNVEIVAVADEVESGRMECAKRLGVDRTYADYREMLHRERPQIVSVASRWLDCHRDMVVGCAEYGCHIFLEKPLCRTLEEADEMIAACERAHVKLAIAHQTRYSPRMARVKEMLSQGILGDLIEMRGRGKEDRRGGGEDLMVLGTHIMDLMRFFCADPKWCSARVFDGGKPVTRDLVRDGAEGIGPLAGDSIDAMYGFDQGVTGFFSSHRPKDASGSRFGLKLFGTKGVVDLTTGSLPPTYFLDDPNWSEPRGGKTWIEITSAGAGKPETIKDGGLHLGNTLIARDLIRAIETDTIPLGSLYDGRAALEMILAVYESHRLNGPVELPLKNRKHPLSVI